VPCKFKMADSRHLEIIKRKIAVFVKQCLVELSECGTGDEVC